MPAASELLVGEGTSTHDRGVNSIDPGQKRWRLERYYDLEEWEAARTCAAMASGS